MKKIYTEVYLHYGHGETRLVGRFETAERAHNFMKHYIINESWIWANGGTHEYKTIEVDEDPEEKTA